MATENTDAEQFVKCPYYSNGWCTRFNGKCSDIENCRYKLKAKKNKK